MGTFINKGNDGFRKAINGSYVDKSGLIAAARPLGRFALQRMLTHRLCSLS